MHATCFQQLQNCIYVLPEASIFREIIKIDDMRHDFGVRDHVLILPPEQSKVMKRRRYVVGSEIIMNIGKVTRVSGYRVTSPLSND